MHTMDKGILFLLCVGIVYISPNIYCEKYITYKRVRCIFGSVLVWIPPLKSVQSVNVMFQHTVRE